MCIVVYEFLMSYDSCWDLREPTATSNRARFEGGFADAWGAGF